MKKKTKKTAKYRDAGTGRFVKKEYADRNPKTTVKEVGNVVDSLKG